MERGSSGLLELVDEAGATTGWVEKIVAHEKGGQLHRAVSVLLFDDKRRLLMQRRADHTYHFAGTWANTACTHVLHGETILAAAKRALKDELDARADLAPLGHVIYKATDETSGLTEFEYDHILWGWSPSGLAPNPSHVSELRFVSAMDLQTQISRDPCSVAPWVYAIFASVKSRRAWPSSLAGWADV